MLSNLPFLRLQEQTIFWDEIRSLEISPRSIRFVLEDQSRLRFEYASPEDLDDALNDGFFADYNELKN